MLFPRLVLLALCTTVGVGVVVIIAAAADVLRFFYSSYLLSV